MYITNWYTLIKIYLNIYILHIYITVRYMISYNDAVTIGHQHQLLELEAVFKEQFGLSDEHDIH